MDRISSLQSFLRVAELNSFTQAADRLGLPKASVSTQIRQLESHLGARLFHRTTRRVHLTQDGEMLYERARSLLADVDDIETLFLTEPGDLSGRLRVDMTQATATDLVIPHLPTFLATHPRLEIELSCHDSQVDLVREGYDCVVRVGELDDSGLVARPLGELTVISCASPAYLERHGMPDHPRDLPKRHRVVHYVGQLGQRPPKWEYAENGTLEALTVNGTLTVSSTRAYHQACLSGLGLIQVPLAGVKRDLDAGRLVEVLPAYRPAAMPISLLCPHRRHLSRRLRAFMDWLGELIQAHY